jgi:hypothetical protein
VADRTIRELIDSLEEVAAEHGDDLPIRIATQPSYPLQSTVDDDVRVWRGVAYLKEGHQIGGYTYDTDVLNNSPYLPKHIFGDPPEDRCENCESYDVVGTVRLGRGSDRDCICRACLVNEVPTEVAETYEGDLPLAEVMAQRAAATPPSVGTVTQA